MNHQAPRRGEVWLVDLNPTRGHEQKGVRPALVISIDGFNSGPADLAVVLPISTVPKRQPLHVPVSAPEGGLDEDSFVQCEEPRSISISERFRKRLGSISATSMAQVEDRLKIILNLR